MFIVASLITELGHQVNRGVDAAWDQNVRSRPKDGNLGTTSLWRGVHRAPGRTWSRGRGVGQEVLLRVLVRCSVWCLRVARVVLLIDPARAVIDRELSRLGYHRQKHHTLTSEPATQREPGTYH